MTKNNWMSLSWRELCALFCFCFFSFLLLFFNVNFSFYHVSCAWGLTTSICLEVNRACRSGHRPSFFILGYFSPVWLKRARGMLTCKVREDPEFLLGMSYLMPFIALGGALDSLGWKLLTKDLTLIVCAFYLNHWALAGMVDDSFLLVWNYSQSLRQECHHVIKDPQTLYSLEIWMWNFPFASVFQSLSRPYVRIMYSAMSFFFNYLSISRILKWWDIH